MPTPMGTTDQGARFDYHPGMVPCGGGFFAEQSNPDKDINIIVHSRIGVTKMYVLNKKREKF